MVGWHSQFSSFAQSPCASTRRSMPFCCENWNLQGTLSLSLCYPFSMTNTQFLSDSDSTILARFLSFPPEKLHWNPMIGFFKNCVLDTCLHSNIIGSDQKWATNGGFSLKILSLYDSLYDIVMCRELLDHYWFNKIVPYNEEPPLLRQATRQQQRSFSLQESCFNCRSATIHFARKLLVRDVSMLVANKAIAWKLFIEQCARGLLHLNFLILNWERSQMPNRMGGSVTVQ